MIIKFDEGSEAHYTACKTLAECELVVTIKQFGHAPEKYMIVGADDYGLTCKAYPLESGEIFFPYQNIEELTIL